MSIAVKQKMPTDLIGKSVGIVACLNISSAYSISSARFRATFINLITEAQQLDDSSFYTGKWTHDGIYTQNHVIDVVSHCLPLAIVLPPIPDWSGNCNASGIVAQ